MRVSRPVDIAMNAVEAARPWRPTVRMIVLAVLALAGVVAQLSPGALAMLQFGRSAIAAGEVWRIVTGHWAHWSGDHLLWSGGAFALLLFVCGARSFWRTLACVWISAVAVTAAVWWGTDLQLYRGLSGIDSALFVLATVSMMRDTVGRREIGRVLAMAGLLLAFGAKVYSESITGAAVFVGGGSSGMVPVPLAHAVGGAVGLACALTSRSS
jgi:rhomboid family GlyGly-CTERM serine protease